MDRMMARPEKGHSHETDIHLNFDGDCEEALGFYHSVLGGEMTIMQRFAEPPMADNVDEEWRGKVLHASLDVGDMDLMGSDGMPGQFVMPQGYHVTAKFDEPEEAERVLRIWQKAVRSKCRWKSLSGHGVSAC